MRYSLLWSLTAVLLTLEACGSQTPVPIPDFPVTGWVGAVGGPSDYCSTVHTNSTSIAPVHHTLNECLALLPGAIIIQGSDFNALIKGRDTLCTETGTCTYEEAQLARAVNAVIDQIQKVNPKR